MQCLQKTQHKNFDITTQPIEIKHKEKFQKVNKIEQFGRLQEGDFLLILEDIGMLHKNVKQQLEDRLKLRNACGHPNPLKIGEHTVGSHIEILMNNVFDVYPV